MFGNLKDQFNQMMIQELVQGLLSHVDDKEMIKEKGTELLDNLDKIPNDMCVYITKLNGRVHIALDKQDNLVGFHKNPDFIDIQTIVEQAIDSID